MDAYNRQVLDRLDVDFPVPDKTALDDYPREGVTPEKVWERPAEAYRYARSRGKSGCRLVRLRRRRSSAWPAMR